MLRKLFNLWPWQMTLLVAGVLFGLQTLALALAQSPEVVFNLPTWGASILTFAVALAFFTQAIKVRLKNRLEQVPHLVIHGVTLAMSIGIAALIRFQGLLVDPLFASMPDPLGWLLYGALGSLGAIGGYDLLMAVISSFGGGAALPPMPQTVEDADSLLAKVRDSSLAMDVRNAALMGLRVINPAVAAIVEPLLNELATRAPTSDEVHDRVVEKAENVKVVKP